VVFLAGGTVLGRASAGASLVPLASGTRVAAGADTSPAFHSSGDAIAAMNDAERRYQLASAFLAAHDTTTQFGGDSSDVYRTRLAALDNVVAASREALYEAPHDPVINRYYLTSLGAREATIQRLGMALPVGMQISRY
jgi:hypothetical protein